MTTKTSTGKRLLLISGAALLLLAAGILAASNLYLRSGHLQRVLNRHPDHFTLHYARAWSWWPGVVHLDRVELRGQSRTNQWWLAIDSATIAVDLPWLLRRELVARSVGAHGVVFHLRRRPAPAAAGSPPAAPPPPPNAEPAIPGLALTPAPAEQPEPAGGRRPHWRLRFAGVSVEQVREVWIEEGRFAGDADVGGGFALDLGGELALDPATAAIRSGAFVVAARPLLDGIAGDVRFALPVLDPHHLPPGGFLALASGRLRLRGRSASLGFLQPYLGQVPWIQLGGNAGTFAADLRAERGSYLPGTHLEARPESVTARLLDDVAWGRCTVSWDVAADAVGPVGRLVAAFDEFRLGRAADGPPRAHGRGLRIEVATRDLRLAALPMPATLAVDLPPTEVGDFSSYNADLPKGAGIALRAGTGMVSATLRAAAPTWEAGGSVDLRGRAVEVELPGSRLRGNLQAHSTFRALPRQRRLLLTESRVELTDMVQLDGAPARPGWWARLHLDYLAVQPGSPQMLEARMQSTLSDTRPLFALLAPRGKPVLSWLDRLLDLHPVDAVGDLAAGDGAVTVSRLAITSGRADIRARLRIAAGRSEGVLYAAYGPLSVGMELHGGHRTWKLLRARRWFESQPGVATAPARPAAAQARPAAAPARSSAAPARQAPPARPAAAPVRQTAPARRASP